jgi:hypothetical protein
MDIRISSVTLAVTLSANTEAAYAAYSVFMYSNSRGAGWPLEKREIADR